MKPTYRIVLGMSPARANRNKGRDQFVHRRDPDDNESAKCGADEGAATLNRAEVTCPHPRCRFEIVESEP